MTVSEILDALNELVKSHPEALDMDVYDFVQHSFIESVDIAPEVVTLRAYDIIHGGLYESPGDKVVCLSGSLGEADHADEEYCMDCLELREDCDCPGEEDPEE